jgi:hypothetical protein
MTPMYTLVIITNICDEVFIHSAPPSLTKKIIFCIKNNNNSHDKDIELYVNGDVQSFMDIKKIKKIGVRIRPVFQT